MCKNQSPEAAAGCLCLKTFRKVLKTLQKYSELTEVFSGAICWYRMPLDQKNVKTICFLLLSWVLNFKGGLTP